MEEIILRTSEIQERLFEGAHVGDSESGEDGDPSSSSELAKLARLVDRGNERIHALLDELSYRRLEMDAAVRATQKRLSAGLLRKTELDLDGLYRRRGVYSYGGGFNWAAIGAFVIGVLPNVPGFLHQAGAIGDGVIPAWLDDIYTYAWFVGFFLAGGLYLGLMRVLHPDSGPTPTPPEAAPSVKEAA